MTTYCGCKCHAGGPHATCDTEHDTGSSGVPGVPSCSPCAGAVPLDEACVLGHVQPTERFVGYACRRHYHWIDRTLQQILELFALLDDVLIPGPGGETRSATRVGSPAPGRVEVMALLDTRERPAAVGEGDVPDLPGCLATWADMVAEERKYKGDQRPDGTVTVSIRILRRERHWIANQEWLDDYAHGYGGLAELHRAVARAVGDTMWPKPIGKCPNCTTPLFNTIGVDEVTCRKCRSTWTGLALVRLRLIHEQEAS